MKPHSIPKVQEYRDTLRDQVVEYFDNNPEPDAAEIAAAMAAWNEGLVASRHHRHRPNHTVFTFSMPWLLRRAIVECKDKSTRNALRAVRRQLPALLDMPDMFRWEPYPPYPHVSYDPRVSSHDLREAEVALAALMGQHPADRQELSLQVELAQAAISRDIAAREQEHAERWGVVA